MVLGSSDTAWSVLFPRSSRFQSSRRPGTRTWQACRRRSSSRTTVSSDVLPRRCILAIEAATPTQVPGLVPLCAHRSTARVGPASSGWDDSATGCSPTDAYVGPCSTFAISAATARSWSRSPRGVTTEPPPRGRLQSQLVLPRFGGHGVSSDCGDLLGGGGLWWPRRCWMRSEL